MLYIFYWLPCALNFIKANPVRVNQKTSPIGGVSELQNMCPFHMALRECMLEHVFDVHRGPRSSLCVVVLVHRHDPVLQTLCRHFEIRRDARPGVKNVGEVSMCSCL